MLRDAKYQLETLLITNITHIDEQDNQKLDGHFD